MKSSTDTTITKHKNAKAMMITSMAIFYAAVIILNKFIRNIDGIHRTFLQFLSAIIILVPYVLLTSGIHLGSYPWRNNGYCSSDWRSSDLRFYTLERTHAS